MRSPFLQATGLLKYIGLFLSGVCHQLPEHSLFVAGVQMPLCARCMGLYFGAALGLYSSWWRGRSRASKFPPGNVLILLSVFFTFYIVDGLNSYFYFFAGRPALYTPNNFLRLAAGMASGLSLSLLVLPLFNCTLWRKPDNERIITAERELFVILLQAIALGWLLQSDISVLLYPLLLASLLSVLSLLTLVNTTIVALLFHREQHVGSWGEAWFFLILGLGLSIIEVSSLALLRHLSALALSVSSSENGLSFNPFILIFEAI
ncbi:MAG: DUF2085 domain-containing protein [Anaerolineae bacterium]